MTKTDGWLATRSVLGGVRKHAKYSCSHLPICRGDGRQSDRKSWPNIGAIRCGRGKVQADALAKAQALAAATQNAAAAGRKRAEEAKRIKLITKRSVEAEISRTNGAAHKAAQAQFNIASRVPLSLRPAYPKHKANKAAAWAARVAHGGGVATGLRAEESRERLRAAMHRWRLRRAERRLTN